MPIKFINLGVKTFEVDGELEGPPEVFVTALMEDNTVEDVKLTDLLSQLANQTKPGFWLG